MYIVSSAMYGPPAGIDPQVYNWFKSVDLDQSGKITAKELQQALFNADWKHFNNETVRLMISKYCTFYIFFSLIYLYHF